MHNPEKLTQAQKRGIEPGKGSNWEFHNDKRHLDAPKKRGPEELRSAQERLAEMALDQEDPQRWLGDVLDALGLRHQEPVKYQVDENCGPHAGTLRGYEQHLRAYTRPCNMCDATARQTYQTRLERLGIKMRENGQWQISTT